MTWQGVIVVLIVSLAVLALIQRATGLLGLRAKKDGPSSSCHDCNTCDDK